MKKIYAKALIIIMLVFTTSISIQAQQWMVGDMINDTVKYMTVYPLAPIEDSSCYDIGQYDVLWAWQPSTDPGFDYGFVIDQLVSSDTVEIEPNGTVYQGDSIWLTDLNVERRISFHAPDGHITLRFFAVGEVTVPNISVPCTPADSLWANTQLICQIYTWFDYGCTTQSNPLSIEESSNSNVNIFYPNSQNGFILSVRSIDPIDNIILFDCNGRILKNSSKNEIEASELASGIYFVNITLESGKTHFDKFAIVK
jgi:hypothetical protein